MLECHWLGQRSFADLTACGTNDVAVEAVRMFGTSSGLQQRLRVLSCHFRCVLCVCMPSCAQSLGSIHAAVPEITFLGAHP